MSHEPTWPNTAVILCACPLARRIASGITDFLYNHNGTIVDYDQDVDTDCRPPFFFARIEWDLDSFKMNAEEIRHAFETEIASKFKMTWELYFTRKPVRIAVMVTRETGGLYQIMMHCNARHWNAEVPLIVSNRLDLNEVAARFGVEFKHVEITPANKADQETAVLNLYRLNEIDLVVLARYMQIVTRTLIDPFSNRIINIHHSMLPAFAGARPYHQARQRGVKFIGATGHYVTEELDAGPIIEQDTIRISHQNSVDELINEGRNLETVVLCRAIELHVKRRIIVHEGRTVIFR